MTKLVDRTVTRVNGYRISGSAKITGWIRYRPNPTIELTRQAEGNTRVAHPVLTIRERPHCQWFAALPINVERSTRGFVATPPPSMITAR
ncbi:hypothetical protein FB566_2052 [Stackebrandtia endophytica]|uniref:Uncharacterized protein n=1 Tax=Stackebrandtia endophytica TaxID=1496996 RepID=A0A543AVB5_9ACTN|nr:hypothetical protein FB566_2052 [Stackebrandtia endophytica]